MSDTMTTVRTPTTGATPEQIEAAARRYWSQVSNIPWDALHQSHRKVVLRKITDAADKIVPPGHVIVPANRVPDAETLAAWARLSVELHVMEGLSSATLDDVAAIDAWLAAHTEGQG